MPLELAPYLDQVARWPESGRHVLAQFDESSIIVYQAYRPAIGLWAIEHGRLGGPEFSFTRMSWIKPNFLWMMYRSGRGSKPGQEVTLGLRIRRSFFDCVLREAVASTFSQETHASEMEWRKAIESSDVRLQWDPDHDPFGKPLPRRALQLGLRGDALRRLASTDLIEVIDVSSLVAEQRMYVDQGLLKELHTPREDVYTPARQ
jgi:uncharacterized protein DUF4291